MRKINKVYLALAMIPLIQTGCVQDNIASVKPSMDRNITNLQRDDEGEGTFLAQIDNNSSEYTISSGGEADSKYRFFIESEGLGGESYVEDYISDDADVISYNSGLDGEGEWRMLSQEEEIIETAKMFLGKKYVWAANGPNSFDCSGFTKYVYREHGISIPRYSGNQAKVGIDVSYDELEKGDLVFFDTKNKLAKKVNHVGIYIGDDKFIHASSANKKVVITSFKDKPFYRRRFLKGERILSSGSAYASIDTISF